MLKEFFQKSAKFKMLAFMAIKNKKKKNILEVLINPHISEK